MSDIMARPERPGNARTGVLEISIVRFQIRGGNPVERQPTSLEPRIPPPDYLEGPPQILPQAPPQGFPQGPPQGFLQGPPQNSAQRIFDPRLGLSTSVVPVAARAPGGGDTITSAFDPHALVEFSNRPVRLLCRQCRKVVTTKIQSEITARSICTCICLAVLCVLTLGIERDKDCWCQKNLHYCPKCGEYLGIENDYYH